MSVKNFSVASFIIAAFAASSAPAATVTFKNSYASVGDAAPAIAGEFDISGFLSGIEGAGGNIELNSAIFTLSGTTKERNSFALRYVGSECWWGCRSIYEVYSGDFEKDVAEAGFGDSKPSISSYSPTAYNVKSYLFGPTYKSYTGSSFGSFSTSSALDKTALDLLWGNMMLSYSLDVTDGIFDSLFVDLSIDYAVSEKIPDVAPIPLPAAGFLLIGSLGGLGALGALRRRKRAA